MVPLPVLDPETVAIEPYNESHPYWSAEHKQSLESLASIQNALERARSADILATDYMTQLGNMNRLKRLYLIAIKDLAKHSRVYEEAVYRGMMAELATDLVFAGMSIALKTNPVTGLFLQAATGSIVRKVTENVVHESFESGEDRGQHSTFGTPGNMMINTASSIARSTVAENFIKSATDVEFEAKYGVVSGPAISSHTNTPAYNRLRNWVDIRKKNLVIKRVNLFNGAWCVKKIFSDLNNFIERDVATSNPYEVAIEQQETAIRAQNKLISSLSADLGAALRIRDAALKELRERYCTDSNGEPNDESVCG